MPKILTIAAVLPGIALMIYAYKNDRIEKEPIGMLLLLMFGGVLSAGVSIILETILEWILDSLFYSANTLYFILDAFVCVALVEEGSKLFFNYLFSWKNKNFNCTYDGLIYSIAVTLGFAVTENLLYVAQGGLSTALARAFTSIPGHMAFGVIMGLFYSKAKVAYVYHDKTECNANIVYGLLLATAVHGFYDYCLFVSNRTLMLCWYVLLVILYIIVFRMVRRASEEDSQFEVSDSLFDDDDK